MCLSKTRCNADQDSSQNEWAGLIKLNFVDLFGLYTKVEIWTLFAIWLIVLMDINPEQIAFKLHNGTETLHLCKNI